MHQLPATLDAFASVYVLKHALCLRSQGPGQRITEVDFHYAHTAEVVLYVCRKAHSREQPAVLVVMTDTSNEHGGPSITNEAEGLCGAIYDNYLKGFKLDWEHIRWVYRDTQGIWDEIVPDRGPGSLDVTVLFRTLGDARQLDVALSAMSAQAQGVRS